MPFFKNDRVCTKSGDSLRFGRVQEYSEVVNKVPRPPKGLFLESRNLDNCADLLSPGLPKKLPVAKVGDGVGRVLRQQIVWDDHGKTTGARMYGDFNKVIDRKFMVGQHVYRDGIRGKVVEVIPFATLKVFDKLSEVNSNPANPLVIPDVRLCDVKPISDVFQGVNIEFKGWIGQICEVKRSVTYKLDEIVDNQARFKWTFCDSILAKRKPSGASDSGQPVIEESFVYPFLPLPHSSFTIPIKGKVVQVNKAAFKQQLSLLEKENKDQKKKSNNNDYLVLEGSSAMGIFPKPSSYPQRASVSLSLALTQRRLAREQCVNATVESVSVTSIEVRWTGRLPADLIKPSCDEKAKRSRYVSTPVAEQMPPSLICAQDLELVRPLYAHPAMYFDKTGLCLLTNVPKNSIIPEKTWANDVFTSLTCRKDSALTPLDVNSMQPVVKKDSQQLNRAVPGKRKSNDDDQENRLVGANSSEKGKDEIDVIVNKHFVRHMYYVIWEQRNEQNPGKSCFRFGGNSGLYYGNQLEADQNQEHKLCLGLIHSHLYVVARKGSWMDGKWDYGVVIEKPSDESIVVEWLKIRSDGNVVTKRILKCDLVDVEKHPTFNELHEGRIVMRRKDASKYSLCQDFRFGTVVAVQRFSLGQISVYCPLQKMVILLWPHMLQVYVGMSMQDLINNNIVGLNQGKSDEMLEGEDGKKWKSWI